MFIIIVIIIISIIVIIIIIISVSKYESAIFRKACGRATFPYVRATAKRKQNPQAQALCFGIS